MDISEWEATIERERADKDIFFAEHRQSPLPPQACTRFSGLDYFSPNQEYRFELELHEHKEKQIIRTSDTKGNEQELIRWGEFRFTISGKDCVLQAYKNAPYEKSLFIPFRDTTSGNETYGAGRYLDFESDADRSAEGKWILDFNRAYNPWCAYSEDYICPMVPGENWLDVPIPAGEKYPYKMSPGKDD